MRKEGARIQQIATKFRALCIDSKLPFLDISTYMDLLFGSSLI
jgi:hypothetical protein